MNNSILLSLKPCYADMIFNGLKKVELRKRITLSMKNCDVFIYVSSPVRRLRGGFRVGHVWSGTPEEVWDQVSEFAGVDKCDFDAYYAGRKTVHALQITNVWEHENPVSLKALRDQFKNFVVPQSWRYVRPEEYQAFRKINHQTSTMIHPLVTPSL